MTFDVCVIGAGVVGLSATLHIQKLIHNVKVTVIADSYGSETNTPVTENLFVPAPFTIEKDIGNTAARELFLDSWKHHFELATQTMEAEEKASQEEKDGEEEEGDEQRKKVPENGNSFKRGTCLWYHSGDHVMKDAVLNYHELTRDEMNEKDFRYAHGCEFKTVHIDQKSYLRWLLKQIRANGVEILYDTICSFQELYGKFDVVVNCVGKRGRELTTDNLLLNFRGTLVQTTPIKSDEFLITQDYIFICPNPYSGYCDVGFLYQTDIRETELDEETIWLVKHKASQLLPELKHCEIVDSWVERRVEREPFRIEIEMLDCGGPILPIVHNIGHGENDVSLAWGRGYHVAHLVQEVERLSKPFAKKWYPFGKL